MIKKASSMKVTKRNKPNSNIKIMSSKIEKNGKSDEVPSQYLLPPDEESYTPTKKIAMKETTIKGKKPLSEFEKKFADARKSGVKTFEYNGKKYNTNTKEEMLAKKKKPKESMYSMFSPKEKPKRKGEL